jgi:uncharacterized protein YqeY
MYKSHSRADLAEQTQAEIDVLQPFIPAQLSEDAIQARISPIIDAMIASNEKVTVGLVMKKFWEGTGKDEAEPSVVIAMVKRSVADNTVWG